MLNFKQLNNYKVDAKHINLALRNKQNHQSRLMSIFHSSSFSVSNIVRRACIFLLNGIRESECFGIHIIKVSTKGSSPNFASNIKGTVMQTEKALTNDRLRVLKVS